MDQNKFLILILMKLLLFKLFAKSHHQMNAYLAPRNLQKNQQKINAVRNKLFLHKIDTYHLFF